jgi:hypothetical protein
MISLKRKMKKMAQTIVKRVGLIQAAKMMML